MINTYFKWPACSTGLDRLPVTPGFVNREDGTGDSVNMIKQLIYIKFTVDSTMQMNYWWFCAISGELYILWVATCCVISQEPIKILGRWILHAELKILHTQSCFHVFLNTEIINLTFFFLFQNVFERNQETVWMFSKQRCKISSWSRDWIMGNTLYSTFLRYRARCSFRNIFVDA